MTRARRRPRTCVGENVRHETPREPVGADGDAGLARAGPGGRRGPAVHRRRPGGAGAGAQPVAGADDRRRRSRRGPLSASDLPRRPDVRRPGGTGRLRLRRHRRRLSPGGFAEVPVAGEALPARPERRGGGPRRRAGRGGHAPPARSDGPRRLRRLLPGRPRLDREQGSPGPAGGHSEQSRDALHDRQDPGGGFAPNQGGNRPAASAAPDDGADGPHSPRPHQHPAAPAARRPAARSAQ